MEIVIKAPLMADKIKDLLNDKSIEGAGFVFIEKKGLEMKFVVSGEGIRAEDAAAIAKKAIKSTDYGKGIYFSVVPK